MASNTEIKSRLIRAGEVLFARHGYGVALLDIVSAAGTPRGSIYYHVPNGKEEVAIGVARKVADEVEGLIDILGCERQNAVEFLHGLIDYHTDGLVGSAYLEGCAVLGITVSVDTDSEVLHCALADTFTRWIGAVSAVLQDKGFDKATGDDVAAAVVSGIEGAVVISRARGDCEALRQLRRVVAALIAAY